ncbi:MAG TPA: flagella basal body P-ring formation protein FlgA, partial [Candidatus Dormibacteraeota bacterium]|nr:flagella basal body P-ring formation protein FlgA [Candidatus Dormibacteraeota bacterium]
MGPLSRGRRVIARRTFLVLAFVAGVVAGIAYWLDSRRVPLVVAAREIESESVLDDGDLATMDVPPDAVPPDAIMDRADAVGRTVHASLGAGQLLLRAALDGPPGFRSGLRPAPGWRAVALPVSPALALGGAITPGVRVDVVRDARDEAGEERQREQGPSRDHSTTAGERTHTRIEPSRSTTAPPAAGATRTRSTRVQASPADGSRSHRP